MAGSSVVYAAGGVVWRQVDDRVLVLLIHRTRHRDFSLPKGKLDPGETLPQAAVREIAEETGIRVTLGLPLGAVDYPIANGRTKEVHYWATEATDAAVAASTFSPNAEVDGLEWLPIPAALGRLSYASDIDVLQLFADMHDHGTLRTFALLTLRHGKAVQPFEWEDSDASRPLSAQGHAQASAIVPTLAAFGPRTLISSSARRCIETLEPTAAALGRPLKTTNAISQDAYESHGGSVPRIVQKRLAKRRTAVLCSHSPVLPEILHEIAIATSTPSALRLTRAGMLSPGEFTVVHLSATDPAAGILAVETHSPPS
ncbi:NUDIX hydrolase [Planctomonas psychrotolerans]|uniref:NUDIX hydrolase n=1 Tax=Planctomonas psychrotolerans TaxID=2528712 RepID=UPI001238A623|nr:NUDIX domain-containing protein [Planctomonas psychrotolerans]